MLQIFIFRGLQLFVAMLLQFIHELAKGKKKDEKVASEYLKASFLVQVLSNHVVRVNVNKELLHTCDITKTKMKDGTRTTG